MAACASSPVSRELTTQIGPPPAYLRPVKVSAPKLGESCLLIAEREQAGRLKANTIIAAASRDWQRIRVTLGGQAGAE
ncbi:MAG: hypothetical protein GEU91_14095 [Rhizobiales bacterium]|nr:hypothetical protein [Hyphomicrobiales bacterium]